MLLPLLLAVCPLQDPHAHAAFDVRIDDPAQQVVELAATLTGLDGTSATLGLHMVERYAYSTLDAPRFREHPRATDAAGAELGLTPVDAHHWTLAKGAATEVRLTWSITLDHRSQPTVAGRDEYEHPYLAPDHGMLSTSALLVLPDVDLGASSITCRLPDGWNAYGPWPRNSEGVFEPANAKSLSENLFAVGAWSAHAVDADGALVTMLFAPEQEELQELVVPLVAPLVSAELAFFEHRPFDSYLILFGRPEGAGMGGSPKAGSMTLYVSPYLVRAGLGTQVLKLIAHEFFHTWAASRIRTSDELRFWNEGFTDYYAHLIPARLGKTHWAEFTAAVGAGLAEWEANPRTGEMSLVEAGGNEFFESGPASPLIYKAGLALAALWDLAIRKAGRGRSLDDLMRAFTNDPAWSLDNTPTPSDLEAALAREVGEERARELLALAREPLVPDLVAEFAAVGVTVSRTEAPLQKTLRVNLAGTRVGGLDPSGLGARVGVQSGDELLSVGGVFVTSEAEIRAAVAELGERVVLTLRRAGETLEIDEPIPTAVHYVVPEEPWSE